MLILINLIFFTVLFFNKLQLAHAQSQAISIMVSPPSFELSANPGAEITNSVKVTNTSDRELTIDTDKKNFTAVGEEGNVALDDDNNASYSLASWVEIEPKSVVIPPKETKIFNFKITVPQNVEPGGHFGSVIFKTTTSATSNSSGASVAQEVASLLLLKVAGDIKEDAQIVSFNTDKKIYEYPPIKFETRIKNNGNVHIKPVGYITITNMLGNTIYKFDSNTRNVLPKAVRRYDDTWNTSWLFGKYNANLVLNYSNGAKVIALSTTFYVIPYKVVGPIFISIVAILFLIIKSRKRIGLALKILFSKESKTS